MSPDSAVAGQLPAAEEGDEAERRRPRDQPAEHDLSGRQPLQRDLDEQEARAPDQREREVLDEDGTAPGDGHGSHTRTNAPRTTSVS